jgi:hypothetical protein
MTTYWFRPKRFGYGATPYTWQGWAFTAVIAVATIACVELALRNVMVAPFRITDVAAFCFSVLGAVVVVFGGVYVSALKTEGGFRWRWGRRNLS